MEDDETKTECFYLATSEIKAQFIQIDILPIYNRERDFFLSALVIDAQSACIAYFNRVFNKESKIEKKTTETVFFLKISLLFIHYFLIELIHRYNNYYKKTHH